MRILITYALMAMALSCAGAETLTGPATVHDADTVVIGPERFRLDAIDAPETDQFCLDERGGTWRCGITARDVLAKAFGGKIWTCTWSKRDGYKRPLGSCVSEGQNINQWLVQNGWALSYRQYSHQYDAVEAQARTNAAGLWAGAFVAPWAWRQRSCKTLILGGRSVPLEAQKQLCTDVPDPPDPSCIIKGNMGPQKCIYHSPGGRFYGKLKIVGPNKRWFCTVAEAEAAGCRASKR
jgi:endonuclease YncB( thermonuclease family)